MEQILIMGLSPPPRIVRKVSRLT